MHAQCMQLEECMLNGCNWKNACSMDASDRMHVQECNLKNANESMHVQWMHVQCMQVKECTLDGCNWKNACSMNAIERMYVQ